MSMSEQQSQYAMHNIIQTPLSLLEFSRKKSVPLILQTEMAECGLACMAMMASYHGHRIDMPSIRQRYVAGDGMNLQQVMEVGEGLGLAGRPLKCGLEHAADLELPCIIHWDMNHFVVLTGVRNNKVFINDPAVGKRSMCMDEFSAHFTGIALELTPLKEFTRQDERVQLRIGQLWNKIIGLKSSLAVLFSLSFALQLFALASPYYMQLVVDDVMVGFDRTLLVVLALGFCLLTVVTVATNGIRSWVVLRISSMVNMQMGVNLLHHFLRLPMAYFDKRHTGDIMSRFDSLSTIRERITTGLVETVIDGVMSVTVLAMMMLYSPMLAAMVVAVVALYGLVRVLFYSPLQQATEASIEAEAKEQSNFLENIRGIQTIKLFSRESQRQALWQNRYASVINAQIRLGKLDISFDAVEDLLFGLENVLVIFFSATLVLDGEMTVGMVLAFIAYKNQFSGSVSSLIEQLILFRMLRLHLDRISDIALSEKERHRDSISHLAHCEGKIELVGVSFAYSNNDRPVLDNVSLTIYPGEAVAIVGESGSGKTTLVKLILGLLEPTGGQILLDGKDITQLGMPQYRSYIAAVMQDDVLLSGSIGDNICFFDAEPDFERMEDCAELAQISKDIELMAMSYNTLVGDMGSQLSGGQIQRILLARALYKQPSVLVMDEATSHLDMGNEAKISENIQRLNMTRIVIAHRPETIKQAKRIVRLIGGRLRTDNSDERVDENN